MIENDPGTFLYTELNAHASDKIELLIIDAMCETTNTVHINWDNGTQKKDEPETNQH